MHVSHIAYLFEQQVLPVYLMNDQQCEFNFDKYNRMRNVQNLLTT